MQAIQCKRQTKCNQYLNFPENLDWQFFFLPSYNIYRKRKTEIHQVTGNAEHIDYQGKVQAIRYNR